MASYRDKLPATSSGGAAIKSVQRGSGTIALGESTTTITISSIDTTKSYVKVVYNPSYTGTETHDNVNTSIRITSSTQITVQRFSSSAAQSVNFNWELVEFTSGVTVQSGLTSTNSLSVGAVISSVDTSKTQLFYSFSGGGNSAILSNIYRGAITSSTAITFNIPNALTDSTTIRWQVVTYV